MSTIPKDSISFNDDGTAWTVCPNEIEHDSDPDWLRLAFWHGSDRPCATCGGDRVLSLGCWNFTPCTDCDGTGRHTFAISVDRNAMPMRDGVHIGRDISVRVHVIDVLPIVADADDLPDCPPLIEMDEGGTRFFDEGVVDTNDAEPITLPPAAAPGKYVVRLSVHGGEG